MNFLKWLVNILFGWMLYVPKKIIQEVEKYIFFKDISLKGIKAFLFVPKVGGLLSFKSYNIDYFITAFAFIILAGLIDEASIKSCVYCMSFIDFMNSYLHGIIEMSHHNFMPYTVLLVLSFAYAILPLFVLLLLFRNRRIDFDQIDISKDKFAFAYIAICIFLYFMFYISVNNDIGFLFHPNNRERLLDLMVKTNIGLSLWIWLLTFLVSVSISNWILMNVAIIKKLITKN